MKHPMDAKLLHVLHTNVVFITDSLTYDDLGLGCNHIRPLKGHTFCLLRMVLGGGFCCLISLLPLTPLFPKLVSPPP